MSVGRLTTFGFASLALIGAGAAHAADYTPPPPPPVYVQPPPPEPCCDTWYLRGFVGAGMNGNSNLEVTPMPADTTFPSNSIGDSYFIGAGVGILLAVARIAGETAPLLFTSLSNQFWSTDMMQPIANLPVTIFKFAMSPFAEWQQLAWAGVLIITLCVLLLNILARVIFAKQKHG